MHSSLFLFQQCNVDLCIKAGNDTKKECMIKYIQGLHGITDPHHALLCGKYDNTNLFKNKHDTGQQVILVQNQSFYVTKTESIFLNPYKRKITDVRAKNFYNSDFFILWLQSDNELPMSEMQKNWGVTDFVFKIKRVENYPNFDKSGLATRHGLNAC